MIHSIRLALALASSSLLALCAGCSDDAVSPDAGAADARFEAPVGEAGADGAFDLAAPDTGTDGAAADAGVKLPTGLKPGWNVIYPGGSTICSRGKTYAFGVNPGKVNKLVVDFEGGGACWTYASCSFAGSLFKEDVDSTLKYMQTGYAKGIYDRKNTNNPFKDWYHVFVPYCTGDIHWGDKVTTYSEGSTSVTINHKGAVNVKAVLAWIKQNFGGPETIFVTGCSAGAYGSVMWSAHLAKHYPAAKLYQMGDSGAGIVTSTFLKDSFPRWNALPAAPSWIPTLDPATIDLASKDMTYIYQSLANHHTAHTFSQYNTLADSTQIFYYTTMGGGSGAAWTQQMVKSMDDLIKGATSFRAYVAPGKKHCIIPYDEFYTVSVGGTKLVDWLADMVAGKPVKSVRCASCTPGP